MDKKTSKFNKVAGFNETTVIIKQVSIIIVVNRIIINWTQQQYK